MNPLARALYSPVLDSPVGALDLNFEAMELPSEPDLRLNLYTASWAATRAVDNTDAHDVR